jgi:hypothetical protein
MAHFAKISEDNIVLNVVTFNNLDMLNSEGIETESIGQKYLETHHNWPAHLWIKTSFNTQGNKHKTGGIPFRGNYAGIGFTWDSTNQIFWYPSPYTSWIKDITTAYWVSPLGPKPSLTNEQTAENIAGSHAWSYEWDENAYQADNTTGWVLVNYKI